MSKTLKFVMTGAMALMLNGCFFVGQVRDKIYEDCYLHPDNIKNLPQDEYQRLAGKCGWSKRQNSPVRANQSLLNTERLCRETVTAPPTQGKRNGQVSQKRPNGMVMRYGIVSGAVPDLKVFYPNGAIETHTRFANGKAEGWSEGYYPSGQVRTRFFYQGGQAKRYEVYNEDGTIAEKNELNCR